MSLEAEVIEAVRKRLEDERLYAETNKKLAQQSGNHFDADYARGREASFEYALHIVYIEMGRRGLE